MEMFLERFHGVRIGLMGEEVEKMKNWRTRGGFTSAVNCLQKELELECVSLKKFDCFSETLIFLSIKIESPKYRRFLMS